MRDELPERDPLADLVSRSLGTRIETIASEDVGGDDGIERRRLRFTTKDGPRTVVFERSPRGQTLEAQLLPFLARRTDRVPAVYARGLPPPHAALGPWLLLEDTLGMPSGCDGDVTAVVSAKLSVERAVEHDVPALRALGVTDDTRALPPALAAVPRALIHGDLRCGVAHRVDRGVVLSDWSHAAIGCPVIDIATLMLDLDIRGRRSDAQAARSAYVRACGLEDGDALVDAAIAWVREAPSR